MRDSSKLLSFNPNRELGFDSFRRVDIKLRRILYFDLDRKLSFDVNRELDIRMRGVVFRGYICPKCKASVSWDANTCDECHAMFEPVKKDQKKPKNRWERGERVAIAKPKEPPVKKPPKARPRQQQQQRQQQMESTFYCPMCGYVLYANAASCPGCGTRFSNYRGSTIAYEPDAVSRYRQGRKQKGKKRKVLIRKQEGPTITWEEFKRRGRKDGIVSWDDYARRKSQEYYKKKKGW